MPTPFESDFWALLWLVWITSFALIIVALSDAIYSLRKMIFEKGKKGKKRNDGMHFL